MKCILITGGAGFIGVNAADFFLKKGWIVLVLDNFSRDGSRKNVEWLKENNPENKGNITIIEYDITDGYKDLIQYVENSDVVLHLAAQVAVTTSIKDPYFDYKTNVLGTINVLEAIRNSENKPIILYSSTNKVYGAMEDIKIIEKGNRYQYENILGISEDRNLDFHSPYGCSKGAADQYVRDYSRIFGIKSVVFRQNCIYGLRQFGIEDQGWIAWFCIAVCTGKDLNIYGDGKQVRDILFISDLLDLYYKSITNIDKVNGQIYNVGGGIDNTISVLELIQNLKEITQNHIRSEFKDWRDGDQKICIMDISKVKEDLNWKPKISPKEGINKLYTWVNQNKDLFI